MNFLGEAIGAATQCVEGHAGCGFRKRGLIHNFSVRQQPRRLVDAGGNSETFTITTNGREETLDEKFLWLGECHCKQRFDQECARFTCLLWIGFIGVALDGGRPLFLRIIGWRGFA
ncbi:hypothetical protein L596_029273 [Steinernema carpocapsae]|uniref:Uncharacterized protein n=1 Tax=Steinernema carpocapsae TaxID=34508 RepID=A0A4U5LU65_STECR|nr:hypothetical protein L596_029273 [Steinernema carpocapsae]